MKTTVIICTRNRKEKTKALLESLYEQSQVPYEIIIVDSSDVPMNQDANFMAYFQKSDSAFAAHYIHSEPGLTRQRNIGVKKATGEVVYFFDDDIVLDRYYLEYMNGTYNNNPQYMGGMGGITNTPPLTAKRKLLRAILRLFQLTSSYGDGKFNRSGLPRHAEGVDKFMEVEVLSGALMSYRREVFDDFLFDEALTGYSYMEDVDFSRRVSFKNKLFYNPKAKAEHNHISSDRGSYVNLRKMFMVNHRYFFLKNTYRGTPLNLLAHWWSIIGLFLYELLLGNKEGIEGYIKALQEFKELKKDLLKSAKQ